MAGNVHRQLARLLATSWLMGLTGASFGQESVCEQRLTWLRQNAVNVRSLDIDDANFKDLEPLGNAIGDARVVLLGEASHGDGAAFLAKGRLIRFLHQRKGFDVLVWESGFYECAKAGDALAAGAPWRDAFDGALLSLWSKSEQCRPVMEYVHATQKTERPITLAGFGWYTYENSALFDDLPPFLEAVDPALPTAEQRRALNLLRKFLEGRGARGFPNSPTRPAELTLVDELIDLLGRDPDGNFRRRHGRRKTAFMRRALENFRGFVLFFARPLSRGGAEDNPLGVVEGRNVVFLARQYYPDRKLIVWAHNGHLLRGASQIEELNPKFKTKQSVAAGQHIHDAFGPAVYSIMFTAHGGKTGIWWDEPSPLPAPPAGSLEDLLHRAGFERAFVDLRRLPADHWLRQRHVARPIAHSPMRANWSRAYDGLFFIDTMTPSTTANPKP